MTALRILSQVITADLTRVFAVVALIKRLADKGQKNNSAYAGLFFFMRIGLCVFIFSQTGGRATR
jgi:hypothetical protein